MILTTNLMLGSIVNATETKYQRIYDRIVERCYPVEIAGRSFRRESAATRFSRMEKTFEKTQQEVSHEQSNSDWQNNKRP